LIAIGALAVVLLVVGVIVGVASGSSQQSYSLDTALERAGEATTVEYEMTVAVGDEPPLRVAAALDSESQLLGIEVDPDAVLGGGVGLGADLPPIEVVFDGAAGVLYMRSEDLFADIGDFFDIDAEWIAVDLQTLADLGGAGDGVLDDWSESLADAPFAVLDDVLGATEDAEEVGSATIDGVETRQYRVPVDAGDLLAGFPAVGTMVDQLEDLLGVPIDDEGDLADALDEQVGGLVYDVWVTEDSELRRVEATVTVLDQQVVLTLDLASVGEPLDLAVPPDDEVFDLSELLGG